MLAIHLRLNTCRVGARPYRDLDGLDVPSFPKVKITATAMVSLSGGQSVPRPEATYDGVSASRT